MNPAAASIVSELRGRFYSHFAAAMPPLVKVTNAKQGSAGTSVAAWVDQHHRLNYIYVYACTAPDPLIPERPLIMRISINKGTELPPMSRLKRGSCGLNQDWVFDLTLLPEEVLAFVPWMVGVVESQAGEEDAWLEPPHALTFRTVSEPSFLNAWTQNAWDSLSANGLGHLALLVTKDPSPRI